jgi:hypothetical protein
VEISEEDGARQGEPRRYWVLRMVRVLVSGTAQVEGLGTFPVYNLSESGVFLIAPSPITLGTKVKLKLESPELGQVIDLQGTVVRNGKTGKGDPGFAVRFDEIPAAQRLLIQQVVKAKHVKSRIL